MATGKKIPLIRRPWFAFLSSMRFAVALLCVLGIASVIGTVLQQNLSYTDYIVKFGPFWSRIFQALGLFDVYSSIWFVVIMLFLVLSTGLCLWRNIPPFMREMRSFRLKANRQSLAAMKHTALLENGLTPSVGMRYFNVRGFAVKQVEREDGSVLVAGKKGAANKWGYIFAHLAIIVICLGGLIDSNLLLKIGMLTGKITPDNTAVFARDFKPESILSDGNPSFRGNVNLSEGQEADVVFLNADQGLLVQQLPFSVKLKKFHIDFYDTGMPSDFASDLEVTDKKTGKVSEHTIRVNHPLTLHGISIYQASFADGGSGLQFKAWDLAANSSRFAELKGTSMNSFPLNMGGEQKFTLEFDKFTSMNVEDMSEPAEKEQGLKQKLNDARAVKQEKKFTNLGPSIIYRLRDSAGQAIEFKNYMLPIKQEDDYFFITGTRSGLEQQYRWLRIPADSKHKADTFMIWRELMNDETVRSRISTAAAASAPEDIRPQFKQAVENTLLLFARGGYLELDKFVQTAVPENEREKMRDYFYQILIGGASLTLDEALNRQNLPAWQQEDKRNRFLLHAMDAYTGLTEYPAPVLLQLDSFQEVRSSGLQMTKSPGAALVYIGSLLLVLGTVCMFYIREKRFWLLFEPNGIRFAMSSSRHERDLQREFPEHLQGLKRLAEDLNHDANHRQH